MTNFQMSSILSTLEQYQIKFTAEIPACLKCMICNGVLVNAKQTICGCKSCEKCIESYLGNTEKVCPICHENKLRFNKDIFADVATTKEILKLEVYCPFKNCQHIDFLMNIDQHINNCELKEISCEKCKKFYLFNEKSIHDSSICDSRIVVCSFCGKELSNKELEEVHLDDKNENFCKNFCGPCPFNCEIQGYNSLKEHLLLCPKKIFICPFHLIGCTEKGMIKAKLEKHYKKRNISHCRLLIDFITSLESKYNELNRTLLKLKQFSEELVKINEMSELRLEKFNRDINDLTNQSPQVTTAADNQAIFRNGKLIWKINNFNEKRLEDIDEEESKPIVSESFYTSQFGYKFSMKIFPGGFQEGRASYLSIYAMLMKGEYDNLLKWPFTGLITFSLLDLENLCDNFSMSFSPDSNDPRFEKPTEDYNSIFGFDKFISFEQIIPSSIYNKNDIIYLKISVEE